MSRPRVPFRTALAISVLALLVLAAAATTVGYLAEAHSQQADRDHRLAAAADYVNHAAAASLQQGPAGAETKPWQQALTQHLAALQLSAQLTVVSPTGKNIIYMSRTPPSRTHAPDHPTASYAFPLGSEPGQALALDLYAPPLDQSRRLLVALTSGLAAMLVGSTLLTWVASRWLVAPLRRLSTQVDAIAGGDRIETRATSPIREVDNVAAAVAGMAAGLTRAAEQDARLEAERRLLVSSIAHDLRTPLFSLRGYLDAIAAGLGDPSERLERARAKADQINRLVTGLFEYARADLDEHPRLQATDLATAVTDAAAAFEFAADERGVKLRVMADTAPSVTIDPDGFERALANVIDNALRHTPRGGTVEVTCGEDTESAFVLVVDDGPGIAPDLLPRVFEPMVHADRADRSRDSSTGGAGLGLAITARLLRNQGGTIRAANAPERGAILTFRFPRTSA